MHTYGHTNINTCTHTYTHSYICAYTHTYPYTYTYTYTCIHTFPSVYIYTYICIHTYTKEMIPYMGPYMEEKTRPADQMLLDCDSIQEEARTSNHAMLVFNIMHTPYPQVQCCEQYQ